MEKNPLPMIFRHLQAEGCLEETDVVNTWDGFYLVYKSLSDMLAQKSILDFLDSEGRRLACSNFFDDWFLYVPLVKLITPILSIFPSLILLTTFRLHPSPLRLNWKPPVYI